MCGKADCSISASGWVADGGAALLYGAFLAHSHTTHMQCENENIGFMTVATTDKLCYGHIHVLIVKCDYFIRFIYRQSLTIFCSLVFFFHTMPSRFVP